MGCNREWRQANTITDWELAEIGKLLCNHTARDLALLVVRLQGQLEVAFSTRPAATPG